MGCYGEEKYSGLEELMGKSFDHNFSDFLYYGKFLDNTIRTKIGLMLVGVMAVIIVPDIFVLL